MGLKKSLLFVLALTIFTYFIPSPVLAQSPTIESFSSTGTIAGGGTTLSIDLPSGVQSGDLLVACAAASGSDTSDISATDWTHVTTAGGGGTSPKIGLLYRFWQPGDSDPAVFTISATNMALRRGVMWRISGADASPSDAVASFNVSSNSTSRVYNSITTSTDEALLLGCLHWSANDSAYTPDEDLSNTVTQNRFGADSGIQTLAGATGIFSGTGNLSPYVSVLWAVAPGTSPVNNVPEITLASPSDMATDVSTAPVFTFIGVDDDNDDLIYEIEVTDNPNDFTGGEVLADNFSGGGGGAFHPQPHTSALTWQGDIQVDDRMCQSFTAQGGKWAKAVFPLGDSRDDTDGTAFARIYEHEGVFGVSSAPANAGSPLDQTTSGNPTMD